MWQTLKDKISKDKIREMTRGWRVSMSSSENRGCVTGTCGEWTKGTSKSNALQTGWHKKRFTAEEMKRSGGKRYLPENYRGWVHKIAHHADSVAKMG